MSGEGVGGEGGGNQDRGSGGGLQASAVPLQPYRPFGDEERVEGRTVQRYLEGGGEAELFQAEVAAGEHFRITSYNVCYTKLLRDRCGAHTFPYIEVGNPTAQVEHEATTTKIGEDQIFYCNQRGLETEEAVNLRNNFV